MFQVKEESPDDGISISDDVVKGDSLKDEAISNSENDNNYYCNTCHFKTKWKHSLKNHMKSPTHFKQIKLLCAVCGFQALNESSIESHTLTHEKPFKCDLCDYRGKFKSNLDEHKLVHSRDKRFACDKCPYCTRIVWHLKRHQLSVHCSEKPLACDKCDYRSVRRDRMISHKLVHQSETPFACEVCDFQAKSKYRLIRHHKVHQRAS